MLGDLSLASLAAAPVAPAPLSATVAFACGYAIGALPVAWLLVRRLRGIDLRAFGGTGAYEAMRAAGPGIAVVSGVAELLKGGVVGGVAGLLDGGTGWFTASAIAGCVLGDAFPVGFRRGGRGLIPLVSGLLVALPAAGIWCAAVALPAALLTRMRGIAYEAAVAIAVPLGLVIGTWDWRSLAPGLATVLVLVVRSRLLRSNRLRAAHTPPRSATIVDQPPHTPSQEP